MTSVSQGFPPVSETQTEYVDRPVTQERFNATTYGNAIAEAGRLQAEAERDRYRGQFERCFDAYQLVLGQRDRYKAALERIACYNDTSASARLEATGSYSGFDEPGSVEIARVAFAPAGDGADA